MRVFSPSHFCSLPLALGAGSHTWWVSARMSHTCHALSLEKRGACSYAHALVSGTPAALLPRAKPRHHPCKLKYWSKSILYQSCAVRCEVISYPSQLYINSLLQLLAWCGCAGGGWPLSMSA